MTAVLRLQRPVLEIADPQAKALAFFSKDVSSVGVRPYDRYIEESVSFPNRITADDVTAINGSMRARSRRTAWQPLIKRGELPELASVSQRLDLFQSSDQAWASGHVTQRLLALFRTVIRKGIGIAGATKILHIKRPTLIPVCDSYVLGLLGVPNVGAASGVEIVASLREMRGELTGPLLDIQSNLAALGYRRSLVRILDALLWTAYAEKWVSNTTQVTRR